MRNRLGVGHFGRSDIPPDTGSWELGVRDGGHHNDDRAVVVSGVCQRVADLGSGGCTDCAGASATGNLDEVHLEVLALKPGRLALRFSVAESKRIVAITELIAELPSTTPHL